MNWLSAHFEWVVGVILVPIVVVFIKHRLDASRKPLDKTKPQLEKENTELRKALDAAQDKLRTRDSIERRGTLFYKRDEKVVYLPPPYTWNHGVRRDCQVCRQTSWEVPMRL